MLELAGHAGTEANHMQEAPITAESQKKISIRSHMGILRGGGGLSEGDRRGHQQRKDQHGDLRAESHGMD
jgi:hypothetical protein